MQHKGGEGGKGALVGVLEGGGVTEVDQYISMSVLQSAQHQHSSLVLWPRKMALPAKDQPMQISESFCRSRVVVNEVPSQHLVKSPVQQTAVTQSTGCHGVTTLALVCWFHCLTFPHTQPDAHEVSYANRIARCANIWN